MIEVISSTDLLPNEYRYSQQHQPFETSFLFKKSMEELWRIVLSLNIIIMAIQSFGRAVVNWMELQIKSNNDHQTLPRRKRKSILFDRAVLYALTIPVVIMNSMVLGSIVGDFLGWMTTVIGLIICEICLANMTHGMDMENIGLDMDILTRFYDDFDKFHIVMVFFDCVSFGLFMSI